MNKGLRPEEYADILETLKDLPKRENSDLMNKGLRQLNELGSFTVDTFEERILT